MISELSICCILSFKKEMTLKYFVWAKTIDYSGVTLLNNS